MNGILCLLAISFLKEQKNGWHFNVWLILQIFKKEWKKILWLILPLTHFVWLSLQSILIESSSKEIFTFWFRLQFCKQIFWKNEWHSVQSWKKEQQFVQSWKNMWHFVQSWKYIWHFCVIDPTSETASCLLGKVSLHSPAATTFSKGFSPYTSTHNSTPRLQIWNRNLDLILG